MPPAAQTVPPDDCTKPAEQPSREWVTGDGLQPGDAYMEGAYVVFTAQFHRRRGSCCHSGCRHCPFAGAKT